jgi:hypothetical protein
MFTHPALLRELKQLADLLRRSGESLWARRVVQVTDVLARTGWTLEGYEALRELRRGEPGLHQVNFGEEHSRQLGGPEGLAQANERLAALKERIDDLAALPLRKAEEGPRRRSPDLA